MGGSTPQRVGEQGPDVISERYAVPRLLAAGRTDETTGISRDPRQRGNTPSCLWLCSRWRIRKLRPACLWVPPAGGAAGQPSSPHPPQIVLQWYVGGYSWGSAVTQDRQARWSKAGVSGPNAAKPMLQSQCLRLMDGASAAVHVWFKLLAYLSRRLEVSSFFAWAL